ncbi:dihydroflavonol-4-reductase [Faunimonas pinastri]|uniref:Dihydroflavonol-4-reductase n=1 Tax=Faunimonas pinastri TaxID=1855383 RepID=A0A1H9AIE7_9HYPH|nr:hopanoid-associated sugar epimerase [Faunimonas pinastri]SEP76267.1 dihydroflavonol-4-reductase [Faunimonas pinastri]
MRQTSEFGPGRVLVTGASGFVGSAIARLFHAEGFAVRVLVRASSPRTNIEPDFEVATGDLLDRASLATAMRDVRYVIHAAADYRLWTRHPEEMVRTNLEGTAHVMEEALRAGVERIVYTSSVAVLKLDPGGKPADEGRLLGANEAVGAYKQSKVLAEARVREMVERQGLPAVIVNPSTPIGPRDVKPTPTGRIIVEAASGRMPGYVDTGLNLVHVDDVAAGHLAALRHGRVGERYILGGENVLLSTMLADIAGLVGRKPPRIEFPRQAIYPIALVAEGIAQITGKEPFVTRDGLKMARYRMFFDDAKARRELGYASRPYREGLADALGWFRQAGMLK